MSRADANDQGAVDAIAAKPRVKIACGHTSSASDAEQLIDEVDLFLYQVAEGMVEARERGTFRDEAVTSYDRQDGKISFIGPKKLFDAFKLDSTAVQALRKRHV
jgi:hypothetical protein